MSEKKPVLKSITGMRGIACLFIVCYHYYCLTQINWKSFRF